ncbi:MAG: hypothetical protein WAU70_10930 [Flavobacteriales bacterium]
MDRILIGFLLFLGCAFGARLVSERALRTLPDDQKVRLVDAFSGMRTYGMLAAIGLVAILFVLPKLFPDDPAYGLYIGLGLAIAFLAVRQVMTARRLRALQMDEAYMRKLALARLLANLGIVILIAAVLYATLDLH